MSRSDTDAQEGAARPWPVAPWLELRHGDPYFDPSLQAFVVTRYTHVVSVLSRPDCRIWDVAGDLQRFGSRWRVDVAAGHRLVRNWALLQDPPRHGPLRRWLGRGLREITPAFAAPTIAAEVGALVAGHEGAGPVDAVDLFSLRLLPRLLARGAGLPPDLTGRLCAAGSAFHRRFANVMTPAAIGDLNTIAARLEALAIEAVRIIHAPRSASPLRPLVEEQLADGTAENEIALQLAFLLVSGSDTTGATLCNAIAVVLTDPDRRAAVEPADPTDVLMRRAATLRRMIVRRLDTDVSLGASVVGGGRRIILDIEQANHDPEAMRSETGEPGSPASLAFGMGPHACLGAAVARQTLRTVLHELFVERDTRLGESLFEWDEHPTQRRLKRLSITIDTKA